MNKLFYPAMFHRAEEGGFWVSFPDFPECLTEGDTMEEAYKMASDALGLCITEKMRDKEELPKPSNLDGLQISEEYFIVVIAFDLEDYRRQNNSKAVKKTLSIPEWLNEEALQRNINFSQTLQEALVQRINAE